MSSTSYKSSENNSSKDMTDAEDYEQNFLEKYFNNQARSKIAKLEDEIKNTIDSKQLKNLNLKIKQIKDDLINSLVFIKKEKLSKLEDIGEKQTEIKATENEKTFKYNNTEIPLSIWEYLFPYQQDGTKWMIDLHMKGKGGILADEMGLGKTLQAIAFLAGLIRSKSTVCALILCPATVVQQWAVECKRVLPWVPLGSGTVINGRGINIMGYEQYKTGKYKNTFDVIILDEGHKIKNKDAQITHTVKSIKSRSRFLLTGTPIQNNLTELWSLFDFILPGLLGTHLLFQEEFEQNIKNRICSDTGYRYSVMLRSVIEPYILRRMKSQISHKLPGKVDKVVFVTLSPRQHELYIQALESRKIHLALVEKKGLLGAIDYLRKICNHPLLIEHSRGNLNAPISNSVQCSNSDDSEDNYSSHENELELGSYYKTTTVDDLVTASCKIGAMVEFLKKWKKEENKVLIFTQTVQMQKIIERVVVGKGYCYSVMSGVTPVSKRKELVDIFNKDKDIFIFLLTTRVGGLGLNLTGANRIILYDPDWNPSNDQQAKERIYRYGQKSIVEMYRIICRDTIEEKIYQKQIYKDCLSKKVLGDPRIKISKEAVFDLFSYYGNDNKDAEVFEYKNVEIEQDKLVDVNEEDKMEFSLMKDYNLRSTLTGSEMIEYIERREMSLEKHHM